MEFRIDAGELNKRIRIFPHSPERDSDGYLLPADAPALHSCWAKVIHKSGTEVSKADGDFGVEEIRCLIRWTPRAIDRKMSVLYRGKYYEIEYVNDYGGKQYMEIWAIWRSNDGGGASDDQ